MLHQKTTTKNKEHRLTQDQLPEIPSKRYLTIGEVSDVCVLPAHVLRYWEQEFPSLKPTKRRGNRRYYQQDDVLLVRKIRSLLYEQGFTIEGARRQLQEDAAGGNVSKQPANKNRLHRIINELEMVVGELTE